MRALTAIILSFLFFYSISISYWFLLTTPLLVVVLSLLTNESLFKRKREII